MLAKLLFHAIIKFFNTLPGHDPNEVAILMTAPTGKAAYLLKGSTLHSVFVIPINKDMTGHYVQLDQNTRNTV